MQSQSTGELAARVAFLRVEDESQTQRLALAIIRAFGGGQPNPSIEAEPVIDTTKPEFVQKFQGFTNTPPQKRRRMPQGNFIERR